MSALAANVFGALICHDLTMSAWPAEPLPAETIAVVRGELGLLAEGIIEAVRAASPIYGEVFGSPEGMALRLGVEQAIRAFLDAVERGERPAGETDELWRMLGEAEYQAGRSLEDLRAAFRSGIRAAWRGAADVAMRAGVSAPATIALAEAIFVYGDELATDVVEGYLRIQSDQAGERERRRRRLAGRLLDPAGQDLDAVARAADLAQWPLPRALAVVAVAGDDPAATARRLDLDVLWDLTGRGPGWWFPILTAPAGGRWSTARLTRGPPPWGPPCATADAARSLRWARLALEVVAEGPPRARRRSPGRADPARRPCSRLTARPFAPGGARRPARRRARAPHDDPGGVAGPPAPHARDRGASSTSIRRRSATGSPSSASCSAT